MQTYRSNAGGELLTTLIFDTRRQMGEYAANMAAEKTTQLLSKQDMVNIIFAAAPSQNEFLAALTQNPAIDWRRINALHMDEYIGLPPDDPRTFAAFLNEKLFNRLPFKTVNLISDGKDDAGATCSRYAELLAEFPPDIVCMGIGENGHIAFNDPHVANFTDQLQVKIVDLDEACRTQQVNDGCFAIINEVPTHAITLTIPALMAAKYIYCVVPGGKKARAVHNTLFAEITEKDPASILRKHANAVLFLDEESAGLINIT